MTIQTSVQPFLLFTGEAEEAITFYVSLFPGSRILDVVRYGPDQGGAEGTVLRSSPGCWRASGLSSNWAGRW